MTSDIVRDSLETRLRQAQADLERRIHAGEDCLAEEYFAACPELAANVHTAIDLIYTEFAAREEAGGRLSPEDYYRRFRQWRDELEKQFAIHELDEPPPPRVMRIFGPDGQPEQYHFLKEISRNLNGNIVKARHVGLNRLVAVKTFAGGDQADLERFRIGAREQKRLQHPNILPVYDVGESEDELPCFAMEFAEGGSLDQRIAGKPQPPEEAARLVRTLAEVMHYAHGEGVIHRDLKPANILLTADDTPQITDFGLARRQDAPGGPSKTGEILGTPPYMAPEQAAGRTHEVGPHSDVYALGAILYELLTGRPPFLAKTVLETLRQVLKCRPKRPRRLVHGVPRALESICLKCLEKNPRRRYRSAQELADDLGRWLQHERPSAHHLSAQASRFLRRHPTLNLAAAMLLLAVVITPLADYIWDPERERERIERELDPGEAVTLIGGEGQPRWHSWATNNPTQKHLFATDGAFRIECEGLALKELVRDPRHSRYRLSAKVRHEQTTALGSLTGIYFAYSRHATPRGRQHCFLAVTFNDLRDMRAVNPGLPGNEVTISIERLVEPHTEAAHVFVGPSLYLPAAPLAISRWNEVFADVSPQGIRFTIRAAGQLNPPCEFKTVTREELQHGKRRMSRLLGAAVPFEVDPALAPRDSLGICVYRGSASFKDVVITPVIDG